MRPIKRLLEIILDNEDLFNKLSSHGYKMGLCVLTTQLYENYTWNNKANFSWSEISIVKEYISKNMPWYCYLRYYFTSFYWTPCKWSPRAKWLKKHIKINS